MKKKKEKISKIRKEEEDITFKIKSNKILVLVFWYHTRENNTFMG